MVNGPDHAAALSTDRTRDPMIADTDRTRDPEINIMRCLPLIGRPH